MVLVVLSGSMLTMEYAHAQYIDPGTGSYLIQLAAAGVLVLIYYAKRFKAGLKSLLKKLLKRERDE
jgi:hypothetical protein